jgi:hypothetical protein
MSESPESEAPSQDADVPARSGDATKVRIFAASVDASLAMMAALLCGSRAPGLSDHARPGVAVGAYLAYFLIQEGLWSTRWASGCSGCGSAIPTDRVAGGRQRRFERRCESSKRTRCSTAALWRRSWERSRVVTSGWATWSPDAS